MIFLSPAIWWNLMHRMQADRVRTYGALRNMERMASIFSGTPLKY